MLSRKYPRENGIKPQRIIHNMARDSIKWNLKTEDKVYEDRNR